MSYNDPSDDSSLSILTILLVEGNTLDTKLTEQECEALNGNANFSGFFW